MDQTASGPRTETFAPLPALEPTAKITDEQRKEYQENGWIKIKNVLSPEEIMAFEPEFTKMMKRFARKRAPVAELDYYHKQFIQFNSLWHRSPVARHFIFARRFARMAAELMGVNGVRFYHDQALYKEPGGGHTLHHQDRSYWPLDTDNVCALWIPFQDTPVDMGPVSFVTGSHKFPYRSEDIITPEGERKMLEYLKTKGCEAEHHPYELGEVSFHTGWTCHTSKPNSTDKMRKVMTINYFEDGTRLKVFSKNQLSDAKNFMGEFEEGDRIRGAFHPLLWEADSA